MSDTTSIPAALGGRTPTRRALLVGGAASVAAFALAPNASSAARVTRPPSGAVRPRQLSPAPVGH